MHNGDWMQTASGRMFWPLDPRADEIFLEDIAAALSKQCRFAGHCTTFYSVAEHSVHVHDIAQRCGANETMRRAALLHDAAEAYVVDVPRPLKPFLAGYAEIEHRIESCVEERFGLAPGSIRHGAIKHWDNVALSTERRDIMLPAPKPWHQLPDPMATRIIGWEPDFARDAFLGRCFTLGMTKQQGT